MTVSPLSCDHIATLSWSHNSELEPQVTVMFGQHAEPSPGVQRRSVLMSSVEEEVKELRAAVNSLQSTVCLLAVLSIM